MLPSNGTIAVLQRTELLSELDDWLVKQFETYPGQLYLRKPRGNQIPRMRNQAVEEMWGSWILFVDSDCHPQSDTLPRLLACEKEIVGAKVLERYSPFAIAATFTPAQGPTQKYTVQTVPKHGLHLVTTLGMACTLIQRSVFQRLEPPWFRAGQISPEFLMEDTDFCLRARREAGIEAFLDCDVAAGHKTEGILWPGKDGKRWVQWMGPTDHREPMQAVESVADTV